MGPATRRAASAAALVAVLAAAGLVAGAQAGGSGPPDRVPLLEEATGAPVASSTLHRSEHGIRSGSRTHVRAGHAPARWAGRTGSKAMSALRRCWLYSRASTLAKNAAALRNSVTAFSLVALDSPMARKGSPSTS